MTDAIASASLAMEGDLQRLATISQNIANVGTPGYRRQVSVSNEFSALLASDEQPGVEPYLDPLLTYNATDTRTGSLKTTGRALDLALEGEGYFNVRTAEGLRYTRRGDFHLDGNGRLLTASNDPVQGGGGDIRLLNSQFTVSNTGEIRANGKLVTRLDITEFSNPQKLSYQGQGLFSANDVSGVSSTPHTRVRQGFIENSNVDPLAETALMMETSRHFELCRNAVTAYDEMLDTTINTLAQF